MCLIKKDLKGSYPYAVWTNFKKNIVVLFDFTDENPMRISIHDPDDFANYLGKEFVDEFKYTPKSDREIYGYIDYAAQKFHEILKQDTSLLE